MKEDLPTFKVYQLLHSCIFIPIIQQQNTVSKGMDMNLSGLWNLNITGRGVTVCVVDDGKISLE